MHTSKIIKFINPGAIITKLNPNVVIIAILVAIFALLLQIAVDVRKSTIQNADQIEIINERLNILEGANYV